MQAIPFVLIDITQTQAALRTVNDDSRSDQVITWMLPSAHNCLPGRPNNMCTVAFNAGNTICVD
jgi:hypothetical protein